MAFLFWAVSVVFLLSELCESIGGYVADYTNDRFKLLMSSENSDLEPIITNYFDDGISNFKVLSIEPSTFLIMQVDPWLPAFSLTYSIACSFVSHNLVILLAFSFFTSHPSFLPVLSFLAET